MKLKIEKLEDRLTPSNIAVPQFLIDSGAGPAGGFTPDQVKQAYGFTNIAYDGSGQTIAIIDAYDQPNIASDLALFDTTFGLPAPPSFKKVDQTGGTNYPSSSPDWGLEISLDVEWAHAIAPGANILLVEASTNFFSDLAIASDYARHQPTVVVESMSFGGPEFSGQLAEDTIFTTPTGHNGVTFIASSGDSGANSGVFYPSTSPNVLAVGGTDITLDNSGNYVNEVGWSGSTGGISSIEAQPVYQVGKTDLTTTARTTPDVSYIGGSLSYVSVYDTLGFIGQSGWFGVYGTSEGAPQWAGLIALADQGLTLEGRPTLDGPSQVLPLVYNLSNSNFHDVISGNNGIYNCNLGYDLVTGVGSPVADVLVENLVGVGTGGTPPTIITPATAIPDQVSLSNLTTNLTVQATDTAGEPSLTYKWVVEPSGPTFSDNNDNTAKNTTVIFPANHVGHYEFLVIVSDPAFLAAVSSTSVTVEQVIASITVTPNPVILTPGLTQQFSAEAFDPFNNLLYVQPTFIWSETTGNGIIDNNGFYTASLVGSDTVTANAGTVQGTAIISVQTPVPTNIVVSPPSIAITNNGTISFTAVEEDQLGNALPIQPIFIWSIQSGLGSISNIGVFTPLPGQIGHVTVQATADNLIGTAAVFVFGPQTLTSIAISPADAISTHRYQDFTAVAYDQNGYPIIQQPDFTWSVLSGPGSFDQANVGVYGTPTVGVATVQASTGGISATTTITTVPGFTSLLVNPHFVQLNFGVTQQFTPTAYDQFGNIFTSPITYTWSIVSGNGTVDNTGLYTAPNSVENDIIQASYNGLNAQAYAAVRQSQTVPLAPTNLTVIRASFRQVNLSWQDNATNATGIIVQRSTDGINWTTVGNLGSNATSFTDFGARKHHTYFYRVFAFNLVGDSDFSNIVKVVL